MKIIGACLLISICALSCGQNTKEDISLTCAANWKKGDKKVIVISRGKENYESGKETFNFDFSYEAHVTVLDSSKDGYTIRWVFYLTEEFKKENPGITGSLPVYEGLKMIFTTTSNGSFKELLNWQEVKDAYVAMMEVSLPKNLNDSIKAAIKKSNDLFNSREMTERALIREIQVYYAPYGGDFTTKETKSSTSLPGPSGDEPMNAIVTQKISKISSGYFTISVVQELDTTGATILMKSLFKKMDLPDSIIANPENLLSNFQMKDKNEYKIDRSTGWITVVKHERTAITSGRKQTEVFLFTMK
jgi:hypothetical protein